MRVVHARLIIIVAGALTLALAIPLWADAARGASPAMNFIVDTTGDLPDLVPGNGLCEAVINTPSCTLRAAIMEANARPGDDLITFSPAIVTPAVFLLTRSNATPDDDASFGDLDLTGVNGALTIAGSGPRAIIIDASNLSPRERVFDVQPGASVTLTGLTVRDGQTAEGGGILNQGVLLLDDVSVRENQGTAGGGGIFNYGTLTLRNSSVLSNTAPGNFGGGIEQSSGQMTIINSTIADNESYDGGGIMVFAPLIAVGTLISGNHGSVGGGLLVRAPLTFTGGIVQANRADDDGGGLGAGAGGSGHIDASRFFGNSAGSSGGGMYLEVGLDVHATAITGNMSSNGGGLYLADGTSRLTETVVSANHAISNGGGIYLASVADLALSGSAVNDNHAGVDGGGIFSAGDVTMTASTLARNIAGGNGGGFYLAGLGADARVINSTLSGNRAAENGGGFADVRGKVWFTQTTIASNLADSNFDASGAGGGIYQTIGTVYLRATILANNSRRTGIVTVVPNDCNGTLTSVGYNLIESTSGCTVGGDSTGNITGDPALNPLGLNGGPTETHLPKKGSPVIDGATNVNCPLTDQRGTKRPIDGNGNGAATCDIGAVEYVPPLFLPLILR